MAEIVGLTQHFVEEAQLSDLEASILVDVCNGVSQKVQAKRHNITAIEVSRAFESLSSKLGVRNDKKFGHKTRMVFAEAMDRGSYVRMTPNEIGRIRSLQDVDKEKLRLIAEGFRADEIAEALGYKNISSVTTRVGVVGRAIEFENAYVTTFMMRASDTIDELDQNHILSNFDENEMLEIRLMRTRPDNLEF